MRAVLESRFGSGMGFLFNDVAGFNDRYAGEKRDTVEANECVGVGSLF